MTSINASDVSDLAPDQEGWSYGTMYFIETALILGTIITVSCIIVFVTFLQKLNFTMKVILISLCIHNAIGFAIEAIVFGIRFEKMDEATCSLMGIIAKSVFIITLEHLALVSFVRHHLSATTAKNENANITLIIGLVLAEYVIEYTSSLYSFLLTTNGFEVTCLNNPSLEVDNNTWYQLVISLKAVLICGTGLFYDYQLIVFLRNQNQVSKNGPGEARLVPWKTNSKEYDFNVPVSASAVSLVVVLVFMLMILFLGSLTYYSLTLIGVVLTNLIVIIQIALTIRAAKLKKPPPPAIERKLNFHNQEEEDEVDNPQDIFHQAQIEENKFRRDVHSVAGYSTGELLKHAAEKLASVQIDPCQAKGAARIINVKPKDDCQEGPSKSAPIVQSDVRNQGNSFQPRIDNDDETIGKEAEIVLNPAIFLNENNS